MKTLPILFVIAFLSIGVPACPAASNIEGPTNPKWVSFDTDGAMVQYVDTSSIKQKHGKNPAGVDDILSSTAWFLFDLPYDRPDGSVIDNTGDTVTPAHSEFSPKFSSVVLNVTFDCMNDQNKLLRSISYRGNLGTGDVVDSSGEEPEWNKSNQKLQEIACSNNPSLLLAPELAARINLNAAVTSSNNVDSKDFIFPSSCAAPRMMDLEKAFFVAHTHLLPDVLEYDGFQIIKSVTHSPSIVKPGYESMSCDFIVYMAGMNGSYNVQMVKINGRLQAPSIRAYQPEYTPN